MGWIEEWMGAVRPLTVSVALYESRILGTPKDAKKSPRAIGSGLKWFQNGILLTSSLKRCHMKMLVCMALCYCGAGAEKTAFVREEEAPSVGKGHWRHAFLARVWAYFCWHASWLLPTEACTWDCWREHVSSRYPSSVGHAWVKSLYWS